MIEKVINVLQFSVLQKLIAADLQHVDSDSGDDKLSKQKMRKWLIMEKQKKNYTKNSVKICLITKKCCRKENTSQC